MIFKLLLEKIDVECIHLTQWISMLSYERWQKKSKYSLVRTYVCTYKIYFDVNWVRTYVRSNVYICCKRIFSKYRYHCTSCFCTWCRLKEVEYKTTHVEFLRRIFKNFRFFRIFYYFHGPFFVKMYLQRNLFLRPTYVEENLLQRYIPHFNDKFSCK